MTIPLIDGDFSVVRHDVPLDQWLMRLVADDAPTRSAAGAALQAMKWTQPGSPRKPQYPVMSPIKPPS